MSANSSTHKSSLRSIHKIQRQHGHNGDGDHSIDPEPRPGEPPSFPRGYQIKVICLYPSIVAGKLARQWMEDAILRTSPHTSCCIEYYNYAVLSRDGISWPHVITRIHPDIILMIGDGSHSLSSGLRHSLRELISSPNGGSKPHVIFRDLEPEATINTRVLLDYVSAISNHNHCELSAMNGNGEPISCFKHPRLLLKSRRPRE